MHKIIINPIAGKGRTMDKLPLLTRLFDAEKMPYEVLVTTGSMDAYEKAKAVCKAGCAGIIGVGGDGTIQEIAAGMVAVSPEQKVSTPLGIFPGGSGNDFVMTLAGGKTAALKKYKKRNQEASMRDFFFAITNGRTTSVDVITANGMAYLNIGNIGLDARVVHNAVQLKNRYGRFAYMAAVYKSIARHRNLRLQLTVDNVKSEGEYTLVAICNGQYYGGGLHINPHANISNGKMTLCLVKAMNRPKTMLIFPSLILGQHYRLNDVSFIQCENLHVKLMNGAESLCMDGNLYAFLSGDGTGFSHEEARFHSIHTLPGMETGEIRFEVIPQALEIYI